MLEWRDIPGFPNYQASDDGQIRRRTPTKRKRLYPITGFDAPNGYVTVCLQVDGRQKNVCVHKLVCLAFNGPPPTLDHQVAHNDGVRNNSRPGNLRWALPKDNTADKKLHGTVQCGERSGTAKLTEADIPEIFRLAADGMRQRDIAARYGVNQAQILRALHKRTWSHVSVPMGLSYGVTR